MEKATAAHFFGVHFKLQWDNYSLSLGEQTKFFWLINMYIKSNTEV